MKRDGRGMQNSGLGSVLATKHFTPLTALPCSISATFHSVIGSILAASGDCALQKAHPRRCRHRSSIRRILEKSIGSLDRDSRDASCASFFENRIAVRRQADKSTA